MNALDRRRLPSIQNVERLPNGLKNVEIPTQTSVDPAVEQIPISVQEHKKHDQPKLVSIVHGTCWRCCILRKWAIQVLVLVICCTKSDPVRDAVTLTLNFCCCRSNVHLRAIQIIHISDVILQSRFVIQERQRHFFCYEGISTWCKWCVSLTVSRCFPLGRNMNCYHILPSPPSTSPLVHLWVLCRSTHVVV